ncbi:MAG: hypothetical protein PHI88_02975 [Candidatus Pacebacteria bacterium]|nr:hypothetical protein [Candidatus Paceibacterota bacterium]
MKEITFIVIVKNKIFLLFWQGKAYLKRKFSINMTMISKTIKKVQKIFVFLKIKK